MPDQSHIGVLAQQITDQFIARLGGLKLSADDQALVSRVSDRLATAAVLAPGAPPDVAARLQTETDLDLATLENIAASKQIDAQEIMRQTAADVTVAALKVLLRIAA